MTRGKPSASQLDLSNPLLTLPGHHYRDQNGTDTRNYGGLDGLPGIKTLFAGILEVHPDNVLVGGNSSLTMMYETLQRACQFGVPGGSGPWNQDTQRKFLCPTPGYDRHFLITEHLGFRLLNIDMTDRGPDMNQVESLVSEDASIKGIWCVPLHSNPTGCCYSSDVVRRLATMKTAATDFRILWDNAYAEHHFEGAKPALENIAEIAMTADNSDRVIQFASTSKMTLPGAGVAAMAGSTANIADAKRHLSVQSIGPDKVNQLRHLAFFGNIEGLRTHMTRHAQLVKPKFDLVAEILQHQLSGLGIAEWSRPKGGYFIDLTVQTGHARRVIDLAGRAGVRLTAAGAPFPYGHDPLDRHIRIAPTFPELEAVRQATEALTTCIRLAAADD